MWRDINIVSYANFILPYIIYKVEQKCEETIKMLLEILLENFCYKVRCAL